jgi:clumping factor A
MTAPIDDVTSLPGRKVTDQEENTIGEIKDIYAIDGDGHPMWVTLEGSTGGIGGKKTVFVPLARLKDEDGDLRMPYSKDHVLNTPEVDGSDGISDECDRLLRDHYGIDRADQELRSDNDSYATLIPDEDEAGTAQKVEDTDSLETPDANKVDDETRKRLEDVGSAEMRNVTAEDVVDDDESGGGESGEEQKSDAGEDDESKSESKSESAKSESESDPKSESDSESESDDKADKAEA